MRKYLLLILLSIYFTSVNAQFYASIRQGVTISNNRFNSFDGGLVTYYPEIAGTYMFRLFALNAGLGVKTVGTYDDPGATITQTHYVNGVLTTESKNVRVNYTFSYLSVPLYASMIYHPRNYYLGVDMGLQGNINVYARQKVESSTSNTISNVNTFLPEFLIGFRAGVSVSRQWYLDVNYRYLAGIFKEVSNDGTFRRIDSGNLLLGLTYEY